MSQMRALHLLIKHEGSRNPVSRRTGASTSGVTKAQAHEELSTILAKFEGMSGQLNKLAGSVSS